MFCSCYLFKGSIPEQGLVSPSEQTAGSRSAGSLCGLSSILEPDSEELDPDGSCGGHDWSGSIFSACSDRLKHSSSGGFSSDDSLSGGTSWSQQTWRPGLILLLLLLSLSSRRRRQTTVRCFFSPACTAVSTTSWSCCRERWRRP